MKIIEIFESINGEVTHWKQGSITTFIRFAGCNLTCDYCDTKQSQSLVANSIDMSIEEVVEKVRTNNITITGGEPLMQIYALNELVGRFIVDRKNITIESNGTIPIQKVVLWKSKNISWVLDYKNPKEGLFFQENISLLRDRDWIKFIVRSKEEYEWVKDVINETILYKSKVNIALSPCGISANDLLRWMIADKMYLYDIILNVQIHKKIGVA